jgi:hypothetical protein
MDSKFIKVANVLFILSLILLTLIKIEDGDIWLHLSIGREIFTHRGVPVTELFAYPSFGLEFRYASWIFGLLLYVAYYLGGYSAIVLLKSAIVCTGVAVLYADANFSHKKPIVTLFALSTFVALSRYRFIERPDIVLMTLLAFTVYALNAYVYLNKKYLYFLPVIATIWAGCQASFIIMAVPFVAFLAGGYIQNVGKSKALFSATPFKTEHFKVIALLFFLSFLATFINPYPLSQFTVGYGGVANNWARQNIVELGPMITSERIQFCLTAFLTLFSFYLNRKRFSLPHLLLLLPFFVLPFVARRFLFITGIVVIPVVARNFAESLTFSPTYAANKIMESRFVGGLLVIWIGAYTAMGLYGIPPVGYEFKQFGLGLNESTVPAGAVRYMDQNGITGRLSNPFNWGGYLIWSGFPQRTVFIHSGGGLPESVFNWLSFGPSIEQQHDRFGFEAVISDYPTDGNVNGFSDQNWALVYWDDTALLYIRRNGPYQNLIQRDEYRYVVPAEGRKGISARIGNPALVMGMEYELKRNIMSTPSPRAIGLLGHLYSKTGRYQQAIDEFNRVLQWGRLADQLSAFTGLGTAYYQLKEYDKSLAYYKKAIKIQRDGTFLYNLATIYVAVGEDRKAVKILQEAISADPTVSGAQKLLDETRQRINNQTH